MAINIEAINQTNN